MCFGVVSMSDRLFNYGVVDPLGVLIYSSHTVIDRSISADFIQAAILSRRVGLDAVQRADDYGDHSLVYVPFELLSDAVVPDEVRALAPPPGSVLVACLVPVHQRKDILSAFAAFGLTGLEIRVMIALIQTGALPLAATRVGVTYNTARSCVASVLGRTGHASYASLISFLLILPFQGIVDDIAAAELFSSVYHLSNRQSRIVEGLIAGHERQQIMESVKCSYPLLKKEISNIFDLTCASSQSALIKLAIESRLIAVLITANLDLSGAAELHALQVGSRTLSYRDHGSRSGVPVLFIHSSITTGVVPRRLATLLVASGFRILSLDRPGFGMTDPVPDALPGHHDPFSNAAQDVVSLCKHLGIGKIHVIARGGAQAVTEIHKAAPELLDRVVLVNPDPNLRFDSKSVGPVGAIKTAFSRNPAAVKFFAGAYAAFSNPERVRRGVTLTMGTTGPDAEAMSDPTNMDDYVNAVMSLARGRVSGYINEQVAMATMERHPAQEVTDRWVIMVGDLDFLHDPENTIAYWSGALPKASVTRIPLGGRMLTFSHPQLVVDALMTQTVAA